MKKDLSDKTNKDIIEKSKEDNINPDTGLPYGLRMIGQSIYVDTRPSNPIKRIFYEIDNFLYDALRP